MAMNNGFVGKSEDWKHGYQAGVDAMADEMRALHEHKLIMLAALQHIHDHGYITDHDRFMVDDAIAKAASAK